MRVVGKIKPVVEVKAVIPEVAADTKPEAKDANDTKKGSGRKPAAKKSEE